MIEQKVDLLNKLKAEQRETAENLSDDIIRSIMHFVLMSKGAPTVAIFKLICKSVATAIVGIGKYTLTICEENQNQYSINGLKPRISLQMEDDLVSVSALYEKNVLHCIRFHISLAKNCIQYLYLKEKADFSLKTYNRSIIRSKMYDLLLKSKRLAPVKYVDHWTLQIFQVRQEFVDLVVKNTSTLRTLETRERYHAFSQIKCNLKRLMLRNYSNTTLNPRTGVRCKYLIFANASFPTTQSSDQPHNSWLECMIQDTCPEEISFTELSNPQQETLR